MNITFNEGNSAPRRGGRGDFRGRGRGADRGWWPNALLSMATFGSLLTHLVLQVVDEAEEDEVDLKFSLMIQMHFPVWAVRNGGKYLENANH